MTQLWTVQKNALPYRQAQVLSGCANGLTDKEMAEEAGVKPSVIHGTVNTLFFKFRLGRGKRAALVAEAIRRGFLQSGAVLLLVLGVQIVKADCSDWRRSSTRIAARTPQSARARKQEFDSLKLVA